MVMSFISYIELIQSMLDINYTICFSSIYRDPILGENTRIPFDSSVPEHWRPQERYTFIFKNISCV